jgi:plastocyanin
VGTVRGRAYITVAVTAVALAAVVPLALSGDAAACHPVPYPTPPGYYDHGCGDTVKRTYVAVGEYKFRPREFVINLGDSVAWRWNGPDTNHSVTSDADEAERFDSDPGQSPTSSDHPAGDTFSHAFTRAGIVSYRCKVHDYMRGKVFVRDANGVVPDADRPRFNSFRVWPRKPGRRVKLVYSLSENATVRGRIARVGRRRLKTVVRRRSLTGKVGRNIVVVKRLWVLRPGRYRVLLRATDKAGNVSRAATAEFRIGSRS